MITADGSSGRVKNLGNAAANNFRLTDHEPATTFKFNINTDFKVNSAASTPGKTGLNVAITYLSDSGKTSYA